MEVYQCKNCGKLYTHEPFECYKCESKDKLQKVIDYNLLMQFAENCFDTFEEKHYYANATLYFYVKEYHPLFAKRYEKVKFSTTKDLFHGDERLKLETIEYDSKIERKIEKYLL